MIWSNYIEIRSKRCKYSVCFQLEMPTRLLTDKFYDQLTNQRLQKIIRKLQRIKWIVWSIFSFKSRNVTVWRRTEPVILSNEKENHTDSMNLPRLSTNTRRLFHKTSYLSNSVQWEWLTQEKKMHFKATLFFRLFGSFKSAEKKEHWWNWYDGSPTNTLICLRTCKIK